MKYIIQVEIDGTTGSEVEAQPDKIQAWVGKWQALNPIGMYFSLSRRAVTIIVDTPTQDAFFDALHATWVFAKDYPEVWPVVDAEEFPAILQRSTRGG